MNAITIVSFSHRENQLDDLIELYGDDKHRLHVYDCRHLPNPFGVKEWRGEDGRHPGVRKFVFADGRAEILVRQAIAEARSHQWVWDANPVFAFGCVGGKHRSVACAEVLWKHLSVDDQSGCFTRGVKIEKFHLALNNKESN